MPLYFWFDHSLGARAEICQIFSLVKNLFWNYLTFTHLNNAIAMWDSIRWSVLTLTPTYLCTYPSWHKKFTLETIHILCYHICWLFWSSTQSSYVGGFSIHKHNFCTKNMLTYGVRGVKKGLKMCLRNTWMTPYWWEEGSRPLSHVSKTLSILCLLTM